CLHAPLFDPGGSSAPRPCAALNAAFRSKDHVGSAFKSISGLNHAACRPSVYASQPRSLSDHATLDLGRRLTFAEAGLTPASSFRRFLIYMSFYISLPLLQALPGAPFARLFLLFAAPPRECSHRSPNARGCSKLARIRTRRLDPRASERWALQRRLEISTLAGASATKLSSVRTRTAVREPRDASLQPFFSAKS